MTRYKVIREGELMQKVYKHIKCYGIKFDLARKEGYSTSTRLVYYAKHNNMDLVAVITYDAYAKREKWCEVSISINQAVADDVEQIFYRLEDGRFGLFKVLESLTKSLLTMDQETVDDAFDFDISDEYLRRYVKSLFLHEFKTILSQQLKQIPADCRNYDNLIQKLLDFNAIKDILE